MAKEAPVLTVGLDDNGGSLRQIENDVTNLDWSNPRNVMDSSGVNNTATERILLLADFSSTLNGVFNDGSNVSHDVLKTVCSTSVTRTETLVMSGQTLTNEVLITDYSLSRAQSGELTWSAPTVLNSATVPTWS
jgi:hypothetical protein